MGWAGTQGWTAIIGPDGQILAGPQRDKETLLFAELNLADIVFVKYARDSVGHYARPDVVRLRLDRSPQPVAEGFQALAGSVLPMPQPDAAVTGSS